MYAIHRSSRVKMNDSTSGTTGFLGMVFSPVCMHLFVCNTKGVSVCVCVFYKIDARACMSVSPKRSVRIHVCIWMCCKRGVSACIKYVHV